MRYLLPLLFFLLVADTAVADPAQREASAIWPTWSGSGELEIRGDYIRDAGVEIIIGRESHTDRVRASLRMRDLGSLSIYAPYGNFEDFDEGRLYIESDVVLRRGLLEVSLEQLVATGITERDHPALKLVDGQGRHLLTVSHPHVIADAAKQMLAIHNADIKATAELARLLDLPELSGMPIGMAWLDLNLRIPEGADVSGRSPARGGLSCTGRPFWPQDDPSHEVDVALINIGTVAYQGRQPGTELIKVAPSATLKSEGFGDAAWIPKFSALGSYPFTPRDQHPFLVWNMYRIADGRIQQLGSSGVKHAFLTLNFNCSINCNSGNVLWPGCEDVYSSGTNDSNFSQGPRVDINPASGLFFSTGSFFDPNSTGSQQVNSTTYQNRLMIDERELDLPGAEYFLDSWYVVMHDTNIWNSMGYHSINPSLSGSNIWTFGPLGPFTEGPTIEQWIPEGTSTATQSHAVIRIPSTTPLAPYPDNQPQGHVRVLVSVTEVGPNRWRYNYAVQNYDFERNIDRFSIPLAQGAQVFETLFYSPDVDGEAGGSWSVTHSGGELAFTAPADNHLRWFSLYNFEVETNVPPLQRGQVTLRAAEAGSPSQLQAEVLAPGLAEVLLIDGFESQP